MEYEYPSDNPPITFKIGELSKLYHIGVDSIRYYEKVGILNPIRDEENNYRMYTTDDLRKLTMIRELLGLNFSTEQIKDFNDNRNVANTEAMLGEELRIINDNIKLLKEKQKKIKSRLNSLEEAGQDPGDEKIYLRHLPKRKIFMLSPDRIPDSYIDYYLIKYMYESGQKVDTIGACDCYVLDVEHSRPESDYLLTKSVFFHSDFLNLPNNDFLPEGDYLCVSYHGSAKKTKPLVKKIFRYAKDNGYEILSNPIEMCIIDDYETANEAEYLTTVQLLVSAPKA